MWISLFSLWECSLSFRQQPQLTSTLGSEPKNLDGIKVFHKASRSAFQRAAFVCLCVSVCTCSLFIYLWYAHAGAEHFSLPTQRARRHIWLRQHKTRAQWTRTIHAAVTLLHIPVQLCTLCTLRTTRGKLPALPRKKRKRKTPLQLQMILPKTKTQWSFSSRRKENNNPLK